VHGPCGGKGAIGFGSSIAIKATELRNRWICVESIAEFPLLQTALQTMQEEKPSALADDYKPAGERGEGGGVFFAPGESRPSRRGPVLQSMLSHFIF
jgi:hypothetical protein